MTIIPGKRYRHHPGFELNNHHARKKQEKLNKATSGREKSDLPVIKYCWRVIQNTQVKEMRRMKSTTHPGTNLKGVARTAILVERLDDALVASRPEESLNRDMKSFKLFL